jgi:hypothetical protein
MVESGNQPNFEQLRQEAVERAMWIPEDASDDVKRAKLRWTLYRFLLDGITKSAKEEALKKGATEDEYESGFLPEATAIVGDIQTALIEDQYRPPIKDRREAWNFWKHQEDAFFLIRNKKTPYIHCSTLKEAAARYLRFPFRFKEIDRLLVDALIAAKLFGFGDAMWNPVVGFETPMKRSHALLTYIIGQVVNAIIFGLLIWFTTWLYGQDVIGNTIWIWIVAILVLILLLFFVVATACLPILWLRQVGSKQRVVNLMEGMTRVYSELKSDGAISANHVRERAQKVADSGVIWPPTLFAVLDDIVSRTGRF